MLHRKIFWTKRESAALLLSAPYNGSKIHAGRAEAPDDGWVEGRGRAEVPELKTWDGALASCYLPFPCLVSIFRTFSASHLVFSEWGSINRKEFSTVFFTSKYVIISSKTYQLCCIERYFGRKGSLLPSYCPPLIMDPKSMLVELRPLTMVELRAVVELRSLSSRREMVPWHRVICPFHAWFLSFGPFQPPI